MAARRAWFIGNSMIVQLGTTTEPLIDEITGATITDATVSLVSVKTRAGTPVTGDTFPKSMAHTAGGIYRCTVSHALSITEGTSYVAEVLAEKSGNRATWQVPVLATDREE
jgi:hypothetical protein